MAIQDGVKLDGKRAQEIRERGTEVRAEANAAHAKSQEVMRTMSAVVTKQTPAPKTLPSPIPPKAVATQPTGVKAPAHEHHAHVKQQAMAAFVHAKDAAHDLKQLALPKLPTTAAVAPTTVSPTVPAPKQENIPLVHKMTPPVVTNKPGAKVNTPSPLAKSQAAPHANKGAPSAEVVRGRSVYIAPKAPHAKEKEEIKKDEKKGESKLASTAAKAGRASSKGSQKLEAQVSSEGGENPFEFYLASGVTFLNETGKPQGCEVVCDHAQVYTKQILQTRVAQIQEFDARLNLGLCRLSERIVNDAGLDLQTFDFIRNIYGGVHA